MTSRSLDAFPIIRPKGWMAFTQTPKVLFQSGENFPSGTGKLVEIVLFEAGASTLFTLYGLYLPYTPCHQKGPSPLQA